MSKQSRRPNRRNRIKEGKTIEYLTPYSHEWWERITVVNFMQATMANMHASLSGRDFNKMVCQICGDNAKDYIVLNNNHPELLARFCSDCAEIQYEMYGLETVLFDSEINTIKYGEIEHSRLNTSMFYEMHDGRKEKIIKRDKCPVCGNTIRIETEHFWASFGTAHILKGCM